MINILETLVFLIGGIVLQIVAIYDERKGQKVPPPAMLAFSAGAIFVVGVGMASVVFNPHPTALDVYQGKTTLEVTYKDGVAIDSVVVFKDKK